MNNLPPHEVSVLRTAFDRYDTDKTGKMSPKQFILFLNQLSKHVPELKGCEFGEGVAIFAILDKDRDGFMSFEDFCAWWASPDAERYKYFTREKSELLDKAYRLYTSYSSENGTEMSYHQFNEMMDELGISYDDYTFDALDKDEDGILSFEEFCTWLNWF